MQKSWQGIKDEYDTMARGPLEVIQEFFRTDQEPSSVTDLNALVEADAQLINAVRTLYNTLPVSAQRAKHVSSTGSKHRDIR